MDIVPRSLRKKAKMCIRDSFLTIGYSDSNGKQQALVLEVGKDEIRPLLVSLEARTGRTVEYQDEEARKAGKG